MTRTRIGALAVLVAVASTAMTTAAAQTGRLPTVTVLKVVASGGGPPAVGSVGTKSTITGDIQDQAGNALGSWLWRCTYLGGYGAGKDTSHFCSFTISFGAKGSITSEGGFGYSSNEPHALAITGGTGAYRGVFGTVHYDHLASPTTPFTYYILRKPR